MSILQITKNEEIYFKSKEFFFFYLRKFRKGSRITDMQITDMQTTSDLGYGYTIHTSRIRDHLSGTHELDYIQLICSLAHGSHSDACLLMGSGHIERTKRKRKKKTQPLHTQN